jgi:hypothetical protein
MFDAPNIVLETAKTISEDILDAMNNDKFA